MDGGGAAIEPPRLLRLLSFEAFDFDEDDFELLALDDVLADPVVQKSTTLSRSRFDLKFLDELRDDEAALVLP